MRSIQRQSILAAALAIIAAGSQTANAQFAADGRDKRAKNEAGGVKFSTKVYRVDDLILPSPNYPFRGTWLPEMTAERNQQAAGGASSFHRRPRAGGMQAMGMGPGGAPGMAMMMGGGAEAGAGADSAMMGGMGGMMGNMASSGASSGETAPVRTSNTFTLSADDLMEAIATFIEPGSWDAQGAGDHRAEIGRLGNSLVIRHSADAHKQIEDFLMALREENGVTQTLTIEAHWKLLDSEQLAALKSAIAAGSPIESVPSDEPYRGQVTCFNGQTVHIVSGRLQTVLQGGIPVVSGAGAVGYQPTMITPHVGALLEITPTLLPGRKAAIVNIQSSVTRWDKPGLAVEFGGGNGASSEGQPGGGGEGSASAGPGAGSGAGIGAPGGAGIAGAFDSNPASGGSSRPVQIDRINVVAQQLATSLRVPLGKPVLVGGMTYPGAQAGQAADSQLYLIVKISAEE